MVSYEVIKCLVDINSPYAMNVKNHCVSIFTMIKNIGVVCVTLKSILLACNRNIERGFMIGDKECRRVRNRRMLLPDCYLDDGTVQKECTNCPYSR
jgi:hypothetical protein